ncbi:MAG: cation:proton antiporter, partial [Lentisphaerae bacterium]|nr:cation:proton antiporter [Lentisphaerota bacterium]
MNVGFVQDFTVVLLVAGITGAICRRLGASVTIGYLIAGIIVGPYTPPVDLVTDIESIHTLSHLGLIFLMFATGMGLSFKKIAQLGTGLLVAVAVCAVTLVLLLRAGGALLNLDPLTPLFIAGMLISSSSAIISRILHEGGLIHQIPGRLAMTWTLLEDLAAIILFSMVGAYVVAEKAPILREAGAFFAFMVLAGIIALLFVPRFLRVIQRNLQSELQTLLVAGLLCLLAVLATHAGYSPALGAFLLGLIIASTPQRNAIDRTFSGLNDVFSAIFFVSIGMLIDVRVLINPWLLLAMPVLAIAAILFRMTTVSTGMFIAGYRKKIAIPAMLTLTVTGEFSFIFAQLGVERKVLPDEARALAVGICILTAAFTSFVVPRGERISLWLQTRWPRALSRFAESWRNFVHSLFNGSTPPEIRRAGQIRFFQIGLEVLSVA